jgi:uncharacterized OsmC-like protein
MQSFTRNETARFQFRAGNQWLSGTHSRSTIQGYYGAGAERTHERTFHFDADRPAVLAGRDNGPVPVEYVLHALAACLTAELATLAADRDIRLIEVHSTVTGDIGLASSGHPQLAVRFAIKGGAPPDELRELVARSQARSPVFGIVTHQVPVTIEVEAS